MKLFLDEDSEGRFVTRLLREAGHDVLTVSEAGLTSRPDPDVLAYAREAGRVLLTRNGRDFLALHALNPNHSGILIEYQDADPAKNMNFPQVVAAIAKIEMSGFDLTGQCVSINPWR